MPTHTTTDFSVLTLPNRSVRFRSMGKSALRFWNPHFGFCNRTRNPSSWWISIKKSNSGFHGFLFTVQSGNQKGFAKLFSWTVVFSLLIMCSRARPLSLRTVYQSCFGFPKKRKERESKNRYLSVSDRYLPVVGKSSEKEVFRQLYSYLTENSTLSKFQSEFRSNHSTVTSLIQMCGDGWKILIW